jgi:hypothetical protein
MWGIGIGGIAGPCAALCVVARLASHPAGPNALLDRASSLAAGLRPKRASLSPTATASMAISRRPGARGGLASARPGAIDEDACSAGKLHPQACRRSPSRECRPSRGQACANGLRACM